MPQVYLPRSTLDQFHQDALGQETDLNVEAARHPPEPPPPPVPTPEQQAAIDLANNPPPPPPPPPPIQAPMASDSLTNPLGAGNALPAAAAAAPSVSPTDPQALYQDLLQRSGIADAPAAAAQAVGGAASALGTAAQGAATSAQDRLNQVQAAAGLDVTPVPVAAPVSTVDTTPHAPSPPVQGGMAARTPSSAPDSAGRVFPLPIKPDNEPRSTYHSQGGSDLMAPRGTPVMNMQNGTVQQVFTDNGSHEVGGNAVLIRGDDGLDYYYAHFDQPSAVKNGQRVAAGEQIGAVGNSGNAWKGGTGATHLHIGIGKGISSGVGSEGGLGENFDAQGLLSNLQQGVGLGATTLAAAPAAVSSAVQTTAGLSGGGELSGKIGQAGQDIMGQGAAAAGWLGEQGQKALQAVLITEGGLGGARGDGGKSAGPLQFYEQGQLANFARQAGMTLDAAKEWVEANPVAAIKWAVGTAQNPGYLGKVIQDGISQGLSGSALATYAQRFGQVSVSPERAGQNFQSLFGGGGGLVFGSGGQPSTTTTITGAPVTDVSAVINAPGRAASAVANWADPRTAIEKEAAGYQASREQKMASAAEASSLDSNMAQDRNRQQLAQIQAEPAAAAPNPIQQYARQLGDGFAGLFAHLAGQATSPATQSNSIPQPGALPWAPTPPTPPSDSLTNPLGTGNARDPNAPLPSAAAVPEASSARYQAGHLGDQIDRFGEDVVRGAAAFADVRPRNAEQEELLRGERPANLGPIPIEPRIAGAKEIWMDNPWGPGVWGARQGAGEEVLAQTNPEYAALKDEEQRLRDKLRGNLEGMPEAEREYARADQVISPEEVQRLQELHRRMNDMTSRVDLQELAKQNPNLEAAEKEAQGGQSALGAVLLPAGIPRSAAGAGLAAASALVDPAGAPFALAGGVERAAAPLVEDLFRWRGVAGRTAEEIEAARAALPRPIGPGHGPGPSLDDVFSQSLSRNERSNVPGTGLTFDALPSRGEVVRNASDLAQGVARGAREVPGKLFGDVTSSPEELARILERGGAARPAEDQGVGSRVRDLLRGRQGGRVATGVDRPEPWESWPTYEAFQPQKTWYGDTELAAREVKQLAQASGFKKVDPREFHDAVMRVAAKADPEDGSRLIGDTLSTYSPEEYAKMETFLSKNGGWGYALKPTEDGLIELVSVFKDPSAPRGAGYAAVADAVGRGANRLDAFDIGGRLPKLYTRFGFVETDRFAWNPAYNGAEYIDTVTGKKVVPKGLYLDSKTGKWITPDVITMERDTPVARAAADEQHARLLSLTSRAVAQGAEPPVGANVLMESHALPSRSGKPTSKTVDIPHFVTREGDTVPLRSSATAGMMGSPESRAYVKAIGSKGGRKNFPVGRFRRSDGAQVPYDSPSEVAFMSDLEQAKLDGRIEDWWRSEDSPIAQLKDIRYINTHPEKFGYGEYRGDFVIRHADGSLELREVKPEKVIRTQEEYGQKAGAQYTGTLGWHVLKKAIGVIPELAMNKVRYSIVDESQAGKLLKMAPSQVGYTTPRPPRTPSGEQRGRLAKTFHGMPGIDYRDLPELETHQPGGSGNLPGHEVIRIVDETSRRALAMAEAGATRAEITRFVRDQLLPTADIVGRTAGPTRMVPRQRVAVGRMLADMPATNIEQLADEWPEAHDIIQSASTRGVSIDSLTAQIGGPRPAFTLNASGDPAGVEAIAAELGELSKAERTRVMRPDTSPEPSMRGQHAQSIEIESPGPEAEAALEAVGDSFSDRVIIEYNNEGAATTVHVLDPDPVKARDAAEQIQRELSSGGVETTLGKQQQVVVSDLSEEGHATAAARRRELLGESPYQGAYPRGVSERSGANRTGAGLGGGADEAGLVEAGSGEDLRPGPLSAEPGGADGGRLRYADEGEAGDAAAGALPASPPPRSAATRALRGKQRGEVALGGDLPNLGLRATVPTDFAGAALGGYAADQTTPEGTPLPERIARDLAGGAAGFTGAHVGMGAALRAAERGRGLAPELGAAARAGRRRGQVASGFEETADDLRFAASKADNGDMADSTTAAERAEAAWRAGSDRYYHGTADEFPRPDPGRFDANGLFGPGYYLTSDPRVAGGVVASGGEQVGPSWLTSSVKRSPGEVINPGYAQQRAPADTSAVRDAAAAYTANPSADTLAALEAALRNSISPPAGPNVRPVDVPRNLKLLDVEQPADRQLVDQLRRDMTPEQADEFDAMLHGYRTDDAGNTDNYGVYSALRSALANDDSGMLRTAAESSAEVNARLTAAGYDGIRYAGGKRIPMQDAAGRDIEHTATVVFPNALDKIRNALTGRQGGQVATGLEEAGRPPRRMYHGTASEFDRADAERFNADGLYGPGYYMTSDPRVAGGLVGRAGQDTLDNVARNIEMQKRTIAERAAPGYQLRPGARGTLEDWQAADATELERLQQQHADLSSGSGLLESGYAQGVQNAATGPNVRPVDVPRDINLFNIDAYVPPASLEAIRQGLPEAERAVFDRQVGRAFESRPTGQQAYDALTAAFGRGPTAKADANRALAEAGFDGLQHEGGKLNPMRDEAGRDISHDVYNVFPESLEKVRNALSGRQGGSASTRMAADLGGAAAGGAAGWNAPQDEDAPAWQRPARAAAGALFGATLPEHVARSRPGSFGYGALQRSVRAARADEIAAARTTRAAAAPAGKVDKAVALTTSNMLSGIGTAVQNTIGGVSQTLARPGAALLGGRPSDAARDVIMMASSLGDAVRAYGEAARTGVGATNPHEATTLPGGLVGSALTVPLRNLTATDEFFRVLNGAGGAAAAASKRLRDNPSMDMATLVANHGDELVEAGRKAGREAVYAEGGGAVGDIGKRLATIRSDLLRSDNTGDRILGGLMQWLIPMTGVPSTILGMGGRILPGVNEVAGLTQIARGIKNRDPEAVYRATRKTAIAGAVNMAILGEVLQGNITGDGPTNPQQKARLMEAVDDQGNAVWRPNSIRVGGRWFDYSGLGHVAVPMAMIANGVDEVNEWSRKPADKRGGMPELAGDIGAATARTISNAWYLRNLGDVLEASKTGNIKTIGKSILATGDRLVPLGGLANEARKYTDQIARDPQSIEEHFENRIPGLSTRVPPRYTATTGKPMEQPQDPLSLAFRGTPPAMMSPNPLAQEVSRLNAAGENVSVPLQDEDYAGAKQSREQTTLLRQTMGQAANLYGLSILTDPKYANATDKQKADALNKAVSQSRDIADMQLADVARDPHHQALREWAQTPHFIGVRGSPEEIQQQNFVIAEAKAKFSAYKEAYGEGKARSHLKADDPAAYKLINKTAVNSAKLEKLKKAIDERYGGALSRDEEKAAAAGLVGVGQTVLP